MQLQQAVSSSFSQLTVSLEHLTPEQYVQPCERLGQSTIGQHVRHIIEMFLCLEQGYEDGTVNYENRKRDKSIESDKQLALGLLRTISEGLSKPDKQLVLAGVYHDDASGLMHFDTNYYREIVYNLEHTIHHMALIRVGLEEIAQIALPQSFGVASATVKHRASCAP